MSIRAIPPRTDCPICGGDLVVSQRGKWVVTSRAWSDLRCRSCRCQFKAWCQLERLYSKQDRKGGQPCPDSTSH